ncbi:MAG: class I SAM-dependent methyltransferase [Ilumatobacteraceae bacterium]
MNVVTAFRSRAEPAVERLGPLVGELADRARSLRPSSFTAAESQVTTGAPAGDPAYLRWLDMLEEQKAYHRKSWEWCYIMQGLERHGVLGTGQRVLGFGVGHEPIVAAIAALGARVTATDQPSEQAGAWSASGQHAAELDAIRRPSICPDDRFTELVSFEPVDMTSIPLHLHGYDGLWSSCAFEHLGSPDSGFDFVVSAIDCLRRGGVAMHTTELDCADHVELAVQGSVDAGDYVCFYRARDLRQLVRRLRTAGHRVRCNYHVSSSHPAEKKIDKQPYTHDPHMRLWVGDRVVTSFGLEIVKGG